MIGVLFEQLCYKEAVLLLRYNLAKTQCSISSQHVAELMVHVGHVHVGIALGMSISCCLFKDRQKPLSGEFTMLSYIVPI